MRAARYLALLDDHPSMEQRAGNESGMPIAFSSPHICVWASHDVIQLAEGGVLIGHLFARTLPSRRVTELPPAKARRILGTDGAELFRDYWGGYVAFLQHPNGRVRVLRDPSGTMPAYWRRIKDATAFAAEVGFPPFSPSDGLRIDIDALATHLWMPHFMGSRTCLDGVSELLPGRGIDIHHQSVGHAEMWSPWSAIPRTPRTVVADEAALRDTVLDVVKTWGDCFSSVLLGMSGGLDSTIVAAGLAQSAASTRGVTMYALEGEGDERAYAELAATAFDIPLSSVEYDFEAIDLARPIATNVARPFLAHFGQAIASMRDQFAREQSVGAFFSGNGGDNAFCLMRSVTPIMDRIRSHSSGRQIVGTTNDVLRLTGADLPSVIRRVMARYRQRGGRVASTGDRSWLEESLLVKALESVERHPWLDPPEDVLPGAAAHVSMLRRALGNDGLHSRASHPASIAPLLSQPVLECCLGLPSWLWVEGGVERSVARRAFRGTIPDALLDRQSKGGPSGFVHRIYHKHEAEVIKLLHGGILRDRGLIQPVTERAVVAQMSAANSMLPQRLLALVAADSWVRYWDGG